MKLEKFDDLLFDLPVLGVQSLADIGHSFGVKYHTLARVIVLVGVAHMLQRVSVLLVNSDPLATISLIFWLIESPFMIGYVFFLARIANRQTSLGRRNPLRDSWVYTQQRQLLVIMITVLTMQQLVLLGRLLPMMSLPYFFIVAIYIVACDELPPAGRTAY